MHTHELYAAFSSSKADANKWKKAYDDLYDTTDGPLRHFRKATSTGREYIFIRKNLNEMIAELHIMRKEANTSNKSPSVNAENGSEYYSLQTTIKSTAVSARKEDDDNADKLRRSMENVEASAGLRSDGRLNMISPNRQQQWPQRLT